MPVNQKFMPKPDLEMLFFENREAFRTWLESNHDQSPGIWMTYYKKHTGTAGISYRESLEEALCFGWIDSLIKKTDEERYARKFTPRTNTKKWSELNMSMVDDLIRQGRMTASGLSKIESYRKNGKVDWSLEKPQVKPVPELEAPGYMLEALSLHEPALQNFLRLPDSCKKEYILWITQAKREETMRKRLEQATSMLKQNHKLGLK
jgi:uncharacterized protein YdeI (YjbR/CyaY-like superfamily)